jgi:hypothetical protein
LTLKPNSNPHTGRVLFCFALRKQNRCACNAAFFYQGIVLYEFTPECQIFEHDSYLVVLQGVVQRVQPEMWTAGSWLLHHNNAPVHTVLSIREFLAKHSIHTLPQAPYSHPEFFYSLNLKLPLKEDDFKQCRHQ